MSHVQETAERVDFGENVTREAFMEFRLRFRWLVDRSRRDGDPRASLSRTARSA